MSFKSVLVFVVAIAFLPRVSAAQEGTGSRPMEPIAQAIDALEVSPDRRKEPESQASPAQQQKMKSGMYKMIAGGTLAAVGAILAATSGQSVESCFNDPFLGRQCITIDARSDGQLWSGVGMAGAGGVLLWLGAADRSSAAARPSWGAGVVRTRRAVSVVVRKQW